MNLNISARNRKRLGGIVFHTIVFSFGVIMLYPLLWMVIGSFKSSGNALTSTLIPDYFHFGNYIDGWRGFGGDETFARYFRNSFVIASISTLGQVLLATITGYGFARIKFTGNKICFSIMIITLLLPSQILRIPQYIMFNQIGWMDTYLPIILPGFFPLPFFIFLMVQFIRGIPKELDEAARIDGCGHFGIFFRILLPNLKPVLITGSIFSFYWSWNEFMTPLLYLQTPAKYPVSVALHLFSDPGTITNWGAMFAISTLSIIPLFLIFLFFQKYLVEGVVTSGMKG